MITDTERLDFILRFLWIGDVGEDKQRMAVVCDDCITDVLHKWQSWRENEHRKSGRQPI